MLATPPVRRPEMRAVNATLARARELISHSTEAALARDLCIATVVVDSGGNIVAAQRMDGAYLTARKIAGPDPPTPVTSSNCPSRALGGPRR